MVHPYINAGSGFYCLGCTMSYSHCLSLSALLASTFITPVAAMDLTLLSPDNNAILEYTHTNTPVPEPASSSFSEQAYKIAAICFLGYGNCDNEISYGKGDETYNMDTANQCKNEGFVSTCSSGYCMDGSCSYNASYGKCIAENCPTNSSPTCTGAVVGKTACGGDCKQCCSDTCTSGSKSYTGSYASTTECGTKCYYCNTSCSSGSTSYTGSVVGYNECGSACRSCSNICSSGSLSVSCNSGYTKTQVTTTECGNACYSCTTNTCSGYSLTSCPSNGSCSSCQSGTTTKYKLNSCDSGYTMSGSSCVKDDPCDNYTSKTCTYGCSAYYSDCSTKCQTCYSDNCHNRTAVSCSYGCDSYYSDCSSKCQTCASCTYSTECSGYSVPSLSKCECGGQSCTACGTTKYKCNSNCLPALVEDTCSTLGHPTCTDAVPYVVGSCCCPTSTQTSTYNCDCCVSEVQ